jgi:hypothetical protein
MIDTLRPSTLGEILDRTAHIYRTRFLVFLGIAAMPAGVILVGAVVSVLFLTWVGTRGQAAGPEVVGIAALLFFTVGSLIFLPLFIGAMGLGTGALNHAAATAFENEKVTIRGAYKAAWKRGWRYIGLLVLEGLILLVAPGMVWTGLVFTFAIGLVMTGKSTSDANAAGSAVVLLGLAAMGLYALWMLLLLCLSFPACVVENVGAGTALKRAISLSKGTRGRILALYILGLLFRWGISLALLIPVIMIIYLIPGLDTPQHARVVGSITVVLIYGSGFLIRAVTKPVYTIAQMLFYYDQRIRKEGFDIEWLMRQAGMVQAPAPEAMPWMPPVRPVETSPPAVPDAAPGGIVVAAREEQPAESAAVVEPAAMAGAEPPFIAEAETIPPEALPPAGQPA